MRRFLAWVVVLAPLVAAGCGGDKDEGKAVKTASGLTYFDMQEGTGPEARRGDKVEVHYTGWLVSNGQKFDSSRDRGQTFVFTIGQGDVIKGWDEGVAGMKVGGKRRLVIPPKLGYGPQGSPPKIPPSADLKFEVELISVNSGSGPKADGPGPQVKKTDLKVGTGSEAKRGDRVEVYYTGWLVSNGKQFDSNRGKEPFGFTIGRGEVIKGWDLGVEGMKVGGKRELIIPSALGYGPRGAGDAIPPDADLKFEVELISVR